MNWYILKSAKGKDNKVRTDVENMIHNFGYDKYVEQIIAPTEKYVSVNKGKRVTKERPLLAGYVFIEADLSNIKMVNSILSVKGVLGFMGENRRVPTKVPQNEIDRLMGQMTNTDVSKLWFEGEKVKIIMGPFANFEGTILKTDETRGKANVTVKIFGRATDVELNFEALVKI